MANRPDNYQDVDHRVHEFWERFPGGRIRTELHRCDDSQVLFVASIWKDGTAEHPDATGWAEEKFEAAWRNGPLRLARPAVWDVPWQIWG